MKRLVALLLSVVLCLTMVPFAFASGDQWMKSGDLSMPKLSKEDIIKLLEDSSLYGVDQFDFFATDPDYATGEVGEIEEEFLDTLLARVNAVRRIAGVASVKMTDTANLAAQQAATLIAACETPYYDRIFQPADMATSLYNTAYAACTNSTLWRSVLFTVEDESPTYFINYLMQENINPNHVNRRRRILSPTMTETGFGLGLDEFEEYFYFAQHYNSVANTADYNFIAWPASGNFPVGRYTFNRPNVQTAFDAEDPWSVTLNPNRYTVPNLDAISVKLTQLSDGRVWNFSSVGHADSLWVSDVDYDGSGPAIIFRPWDLDVLDGLYTVEISGLRAKDGSAATIRYQVDCFEPGAYEVNTATAAAAKTAPYFSDVAADYWGYNAIQLAHQENIMNGVGDGTAFDPNKSISLAEMMAVLVRMYYPDEINHDTEPGTPWYEHYRQAAMVHGLIAQLTNISDWTRSMTRGEIAIMLYNMMVDHNITLRNENVKKAVVNSFVDMDYAGTATADGGVPYQDYSIGNVVAYGLMNGVGDSFLPNETFTRAQLAALACNLMYCLPFEPEEAPAASTPAPAPTATPAPTPAPAESEAPVASAAPVESTAPA